VPYNSAELSASGDDVAELRLVARRTWRYFEDHVTALDRELPPDNFQEHPAPVVAHRTSPTNIGLYLLSVVAARDFGWIGTSEALERMERTMDSVDALEHLDGHLFNWYDTTTGEPLTPRYVSTVDNGNLASHLLVAANACREWIDRPDAHGTPAAGIRDALALLRESRAEHSARDAALLDELDRLVADFPTKESAILDESLIARTRAVAERALAAGPGDDCDEASVWAAAALASLDSQRRDARLSPDGIAARAERLARLESRLRAEVLGMDFGFLFDERRGLLSVGYQVDEEHLDESCYDLLASESRVASYLAIAKGDVRSRHWFRLGRPVTAVQSAAALASWSGSMFELASPMMSSSPPTRLGSPRWLIQARRRRTIAP
jgi:cyclic beta-1,2-glucan synthetase